MNESVFEAEKRVFDNTHCGACGSYVNPGELGWMSLRHPNGEISKFDHLCEDCCVRLADFFEILQVRC